MRIDDSKHAKASYHIDTGHNLLYQWMPTDPT